MGHFSYPDPDPDSESGSINLIGSGFDTLLLSPHPTPTPILSPLLFVFYIHVQSSYTPCWTSSLFARLSALFKTFHFNLSDSDFHAFPVVLLHASLYFSSSWSGALAAGPNMWAGGPVARRVLARRGLRGGGGGGGGAVLAGSQLQVSRSALLAAARFGY